VISLLSPIFFTFVIFRAVPKPSILIDQLRGSQMKSNAPFVHLLVCVSVAAAFSAIPAAASGAEIFVANEEAGTIGEYDTATATAINTSLVPGLVYPGEIAVSNGDILVSGWDGGWVDEFTASGTPVNVPLLSGFGFPAGIAVSGDDMFVTNGANKVGEFTTAGATINSSFITVSSPQFPNLYGIAVSGNDLFVGFNEFNAGAGHGKIAEYDATTGAVINANFITGLNQPEGITISGNDLFVVNNADDNNAGGILTNGTVGEYDLTTGATINSALVAGLNQPVAVAVLGNDLFVTSNPNPANTGIIGEYDLTTGTAINATFITGLDDPQGIAIIAPEPSTWVMFLVGAGTLLVYSLRKRSSQG
jgi:hypothetical protein